jgi:hypothetical protein
MNRHIWLFTVHMSTFFFFLFPPSLTTHYHPPEKTRSDANAAPLNRHRAPLSTLTLRSDQAYQSSGAKQPRCRHRLRAPTHRPPHTLSHFRLPKEVAPATREATVDRTGSGSWL